MPDTRSQQAAWIQRVLGITLPGAATPAGRARAWQDARAAWTAASDSVDQQISALQTVLRETDDPELHDIAEYGLNAMAGGFKTRLRAALLDLGDAPPDGASPQAARVLAAVRGLREAIASDPRVEACDTNPGGVKVAIRATMLPALDRMQAALA